MHFRKRYIVKGVQDDMSLKTIFIWLRNAVPKKVVHPSYIECIFTRDLYIKHQLTESTVKFWTFFEHYIQSSPVVFLNHKKNFARSRKISSASRKIYYSSRILTLFCMCDTLIDIVIFNYLTLYFFSPVSIKLSLTLYYFSSVSIAL